MSSDDELRAAITGVFAEVPADDLRRRIGALCQGLSDEAGENNQLDREWVHQVYPRLESWLHRLKILESSYQERVAAFLRVLQQTAPFVNELGDELAQTRLERTWAAITEHIESVIPNDLLGCDSAEFSIDLESETAWWTAGSDDPGLELPTVVTRCLQMAGEFSDESAHRVGTLFVKSLGDGTAPLPGFQFEDIRDDVAIWQWLSPEKESADTPTETDLLIDDEVQLLWEKAPEATAQLQLSGYLPLRESAATCVPTLVAKIRSLGMPEWVVMREIGTPLAISECRALQRGDLVQFQRASGAMLALRTELRLDPIRENAVTAE